MKDDKKKLTVVIALAVVCVGVGAFQFIGSSQPAPQAKKESGKKDDKGKPGAVAKGDPNAEATQGTEGNEEDPMNSLYTMALSPRDPFDEGTLPGADPAAPTTAQQQQTPPATTSTPSRPGGRRPSGPSGFVPPVLPGQLGSGLPNISISPDGQGQPIGDQPDGGYTVSGVIQGEKNAAIVSDSSGNQRLVEEGQSLDGDTKVVSVKNGNVVVRRKGKNVTLKMGGNP